MIDRTKKHGKARASNDKHLVEAMASLIGEQQEVFAAWIYCPHSLPTLLAALATFKADYIVYPTGGDEYEAITTIDPCVCLGGVPCGGDHRISSDQAADMLREDLDGSDSLGSVKVSPAWRARIERFSNQLQERNSA